jgi:hypothetical protein
VTEQSEYAKRVADAVYGTILVLAVVAALSRDSHATSGAVLVAVLATSLVFWLAHIYADVLSRRASGDASPLAGIVKHAARQEWPLVEAAFAPALPLLLGWAGVFGRSPAITVSLVIGLGDLAAWGYVAGRAMQQSRARAVLSALAALALGAVMVLLKNAVH